MPNNNKSHLLVTTQISISKVAVGGMDSPCLKTVHLFPGSFGYKLERSINDDEKTPGVRSLSVAWIRHA
jgi:hypothetical protein